MYTHYTSCHSTTGTESSDLRQPVCVVYTLSISRGAWWEAAGPAGISGRSVFMLRLSSSSAAAGAAFGSG